MKGLTLLGPVAALALSACDGPYQRSGEKADAEHGTREHLGAGPGEAAGRAIDQSLAQARTAVKADADAMQTHAENIADAIDRRADQLEAQADQLRYDAKRKAEAIRQAVED